MMYLFFAVAVVCDALRDAYIWEQIHPDGTPLAVNRLFWHPIKNASLLFYVLVGVYMITFWQIVACAPGMFVLWRLTYRAARHLPLLEWTLNISEFIPVCHKVRRDVQYVDGMTVIDDATAQDIKWTIQGRTCAILYSVFVILSGIGIYLLERSLI